MNTVLLPRARLRDVIAGRARLVGSRMDSAKPRGILSPIEPKLLMGIPYGNLREAEEEYLARRSVRRDLGVITKAAFSSMLAPRSSAAPAGRPFIVAARVDNLTIDEAASRIINGTRLARARFVFIVHAHALNLARFNRGYAEALESADLVLPDGIGIRLAARLLAVPLRHNLNGTDLFPILCREAAAKHIPMVLIGGAAGVAASCARRMAMDVPGLDVRLTSPGFFRSRDDVAALVAAVKSLGPALVLVGMGSPRQEQWSIAELRECAGATVVTVGGLFDFYSGRIPRAPAAWRELGLEWAYRLRQEPRRLAKRYLLGNPLFLALAFGQRLGGKRR